MFGHPFIQMCWRMVSCTAFAPRSTLVTQVTLAMNSSTDRSSPLHQFCVNANTLEYLLLLAIGTSDYSDVTFLATTDLNARFFCQSEQ